MKGKRSVVARSEVGVGLVSAAGAARLLCTGVAVGHKDGCMWTVWLDSIDKDVLGLDNGFRRSAMGCGG